MAKRKQRQPRQRSLPGTQSPKNQAIETAAHNYMEARDERMEHTTIEVDKKGKLLAAMNKANLTTYRRNGLTVEIVNEKQKLKVRHKAKEVDDTDDVGDGGDSVDVQHAEG